VGWLELSGSYEKRWTRDSCGGANGDGGGWYQKGGRSCQEGSMTVIHFRGKVSRSGAFTTRWRIGRLQKDHVKGGGQQPGVEGG